MVAALEVDQGCLERQAAGACPALAPPEKDTWLDTLENGDYAHAQRVMHMHPSKAAAFVAIEVRREVRELRAEQQEAKGELLAAIEKGQRAWYAGAWKGIAAAVMAIAGYYGASKGGVAPP